MSLTKDFKNHAEYQALIIEENDLTQKLIKIMRYAPIEINYTILADDTFVETDYNKELFQERMGRWCKVKDRLQEIRLEIISKYYKPKV